MIEYVDGIGYKAGHAGEGMYEVDDGTMLESVEALKEAIVGHRIVKVEREGLTPLRPEDEDRWFWAGNPALNLTLDDGTVVQMQEYGDCCAYTDLRNVIEHLPTMDHIITNVTAVEDDFERWHILADFGEVLELEVGWSCGNPFYYGYGFSITVERGGATG